jgi:5-methylcytosine-specific restriction endonuclease McrA
VPRKPKTIADLKAEKAGYKNARHRSRIEYEQLRRRDPRLRAANTVYTSRRWRKVRLMALERQPVCIDCADIGKTSGRNLHVHHIRHPYDAPELAYDLDNLEVLCASCHNKRHKSGGR